MPKSEAAIQLTYLMRPLAEWLDDPETEELCINRPEEAFIRQRGEFRREPIPLTLADLEDIAILAGALRKQDVGPRNPLCATELPEGSGCRFVCRRQSPTERLVSRFESPAKVSRRSKPLVPATGGNAGISGKDDRKHAIATLAPFWRSMTLATWKASLRPAFARSSPYCFAAPLVQARPP